jgi:hypothetical protein
MKQYAICLILGVLAFPCSAQTEKDVGSVTVAGQKDATAQPTYKLWAEDVKEYKGSYSLSNGMTLYLTGYGRHMYGRVDNQSIHELVKIAPDKFVALDKKMAMHLVLQNDNASGELEFVNEAADRVAGVPAEGEWVRIALR